MSPFDFVKSINEKKHIYTEIDKKEYTSYIINKAFSFFPDTIFLANEINKWPDTEPKHHYNFYFHSVTKRSRYSKWVKALPKDEDAVLISKALNIRYERAVEIMSILSDHELKQLKDEIDIDGLTK